MSTRTTKAGLITAAMRNGGLRAIPSQALNVLVSAVITPAFAITVVVGHDLHAAIGVIGI